MVLEDKSAGDGHAPGSASKPVLPQRAGALFMGDLIDLYMAHYAGRDPTRTQRLGWWSKRIGEGLGLWCSIGPWNMLDNRGRQ